MAPPRLSIITPVKNAAPWLRDCIHSCQKQAFTDWEWIFVDDHSDDNSLRILGEIAETEPRFKVYQNPGSGIIPALQKALQQSQGEFITRMDADDLMPAGRLEKMLGLIEQSPGGTIVTGLVQYFSEEAVSEGYRTYEAWLNRTARHNLFWQNIYRECVIASPNWMMRTQELRDMGGFDELNYPEDYDLVFRWYAHSFRVEVVPEVTLHWREHPLRTSRRSKDYSQKAFFRMKIKRFLELDHEPQKSLCLWGPTQKGRLAAKLLEEAGVDFQWMGMSHKPQWLRGRSIHHYSNLSEVEQPQLLIAVYPPEPAKTQILEYLDRQQLRAGKDYWFL